MQSGALSVRSAPTNARLPPSSQLYSPALRKSQQRSIRTWSRRCWCVSLQSGGCIVTSSAKRRLSHKPGSGDGDGTGGGSRARDDYLHWNILAERLEVPGAYRHFGWDNGTL